MLGPVLVIFAVIVGTALYGLACYRLGMCQMRDAFQRQLRDGFAYGVIVPGPLGSVLTTNHQAPPKHSRRSPLEPEFVEPSPRPWGTPIDLAGGRYNDKDGC